VLYGLGLGPIVLGAALAGAAPTTAEPSATAPPTIIVMIAIWNRCFGDPAVALSDIAIDMRPLLSAFRDARTYAASLLYLSGDRNPGLARSPYRPR
jgi:hypothetical protein